jgi:hypothetical protein
VRKAFAGLAILLMLIVVAQFFFAASGAFSTGPREEAFRAHHALGYVIFLLPVVMTIVAALARIPWRVIGMTALIAGLTTVQVLIAVLAKAIGEATTGGQLIFGLHALNGLAILVVAGMIVRQARALARSAVPARRTGGDDASASGPVGASGPVAGSARPAAS